MIGKYNVYWQNNIVGEVAVSKAGMFYEIHCHCESPSNGAYYLWIVWKNHSEKLGICASGQKGYGLKTKLSQKRVGECNPRFELREREPEQELIFIEEITNPYPLLIKLPDLRIRTTDEKCGIITKQKAQGSPDSDPIL